MKIETMRVGPLQANCYLLACEDTAQAAVIDPGGDEEKILGAVDRLGLKLSLIINTHAHFDHTAANGPVQKATGAEICIHPDDVSALEGQSVLAMQFGVYTEDSPAPGRLLNDGDEIKFGNVSLRILHTPGHSPGGISVYGGGSLFSGDTLFAGSVGRSDLPGGDMDALIAGIRKKLFTLPEDTVVYPGHMGVTTIGDEKRYNPFVR